MIICNDIDWDIMVNYVFEYVEVYSLVMSFSWDSFRFFGILDYNVSIRFYSYTVLFKCRYMMNFVYIINLL